MTGLCRAIPVPRRLDRDVDSEERPSHLLTSGAGGSVRTETTETHASSERFASSDQAAFDGDLCGGRDHAKRCEPDN